MNIVCVEPIGINQSQFEKLKSKFASLGHNFTYYLDRKEDPSTLVSRLSSAHMAVISNIPLPQEVLCQCPNLKYLSVAFTGLDHIDLSYCKQHGRRQRTRHWSYARRTAPYHATSQLHPPRRKPWFLPRP